MAENELNDFDKTIIEQIEHAKTQQSDFSHATHLEVAQKVFGFSGFKENGQEKIIQFILKKQGNVLGIIPTGGGKSACFQIPALIQKNMTVIISPLIALMKDQVESLVKKGVYSTFFINSSIEDDVKEKIITLIKDNKVKMLYIAPESLQSDKIKNVLSKTKIDLIVIDEAHCISTWGHNFRPDYLKLAEMIDALGSPPVLALTATATKKTILDIKTQLKKKFEVFQASFDRPTLYMVVQHVPDNVDKDIFLLNLIRKLSGPTVVFARTRELTENLADLLNKNDVKSVFYHAGLSSEERQKRQNLFMNGECDIIIATIAFGMGIDKKNIRNVVHYNIPQSVEGYYQEIGRAGRDGHVSNCILLFTEGDIHRIKALISADWPNKEKIEGLINHLKSKTTDVVCTSAKSLEYETDIKEIPIRLILHRLEQAGAIKQYTKVIHNFKAKFNRSYETIIALSNKNYSEDLKKIFNAPYFKNKRSIVNIEMLSEETKINYFRLLEIFTYIAGEKYIERLNENYKDIIIVQQELRLFDINPLVNLFQDILNNNYQKVDDLVESLTTTKCVRRNVLAYFDEPQLKDSCSMCSNCISYDIVTAIPMKLNENYASNEEINTLSDKTIDVDKEELHMILLKAIGIDKHISKKDFVKILKGTLHRLSAQWKFKLYSYGLLADGTEEEIDETLNKLISDYFVEVTPERELRITKKGIHFINK